MDFMERIGDEVELYRRDEWQDSFLEWDPPIEDQRYVMLFNRWLIHCKPQVLALVDEAVKDDPQILNRIFHILLDQTMLERCLAKFQTGNYVDAFYLELVKKLATKENVHLACGSSLLETHLNGQYMKPGKEVLLEQLVEHLLSLGAPQPDVWWISYVTFKSPELKYLDLDTSIQRLKNIQHYHPDILKKTFYFIDHNEKRTYNNTILHLVAMRYLQAQCEESEQYFCRLFKAFTTPENVTAKNSAWHTPLEYCLAKKVAAGVATKEESVLDAVATHLLTYEKNWLMIPFNYCHIMDFNWFATFLEEATTYNKKMCNNTNKEGNTILHKLLETYASAPNVNSEVFLKLTKIVATEVNVKMKGRNSHIPMDFLRMKQACLGFDDQDEYFVHMVKHLEKLGSPVPTRWVYSLVASWHTDKYDQDRIMKMVKQAIEINSSLASVKTDSEEVQSDSTVLHIFLDQYDLQHDDRKYFEMMKIVATTKNVAIMRAKDGWNGSFPLDQLIKSREHNFKHNEDVQKQMFNHLLQLGAPCSYHLETLMRSCMNYNINTDTVWYEIVLLLMHHRPDPSVNVRLNSIGTAFIVRKEVLGVAREIVNSAFPSFKKCTTGGDELCVLLYLGNSRNQLGQEEVSYIKEVINWRRRPQRAIVSDDRNFEGELWLGRSLFHWFVAMCTDCSRLLEVLNLLADEERDELLKLRDCHGSTPAHVAALHKQDGDMVKYLSLDQSDNFSCSPQMLLCRLSEIDIMAATKMRLTSGAPPDVQHICVCKRYVEGKELSKAAVISMIKLNREEMEIMKHWIRCFFICLLSDESMNIHLRLSEEDAAAEMKKPRLIYFTGSVAEQTKVGRCDEFDVHINFLALSHLIREVDMVREYIRCTICPWSTDTHVTVSSLGLWILQQLQRAIGHADFQGLPLRVVCIHGGWHFLCEDKRYSNLFGMRLSLDVVPVIELAPETKISQNDDPYGIVLFSASHMQIVRKYKIFSVKDLHTVQKQLLKHAFVYKPELIIKWGATTTRPHFEPTYYRYERDILNAIPLDTRLGWLILKCILYCFYWANGGHYDHENAEPSITSYIIKTAMMYELEQDIQDKKLQPLAPNKDLDRTSQELMESLDNDTFWNAGVCWARRILMRVHTIVSGEFCSYFYFASGCDLLSPKKQESILAELKEIETFINQIKK